MDILALVGAVFAKVDNVAILILLLVFVWREWSRVQERKEEREDLQKIAAAIEKQAEAITRLTTHIVATTGKAVP